MSKIFDEIDQLQSRINKLRPLSDHQLRQIKEYYRIGLTYSSNALEGNSLTETETKVVIEDGLTVNGKPLRDHLEAIGHSDAYSFLYTNIHAKEFTQETIKNFHHLFYFRIDEKYAGVYRDKEVLISGSKYALPKAAQVPKLMEEFVEQYGRLSTKIHPVEWAAKVHKEFVFVHPFIDGNGRVARLLMNLVLLQAGFEIAIIPPMLRTQYINALEKAHVDDEDFILFIAQCVKETQKDYLRMLE
jgi:Fic family protein